MLLLKPVIKTKKERISSEECRHLYVESKLVDEGYFEHMHAVEYNKNNSIKQLGDYYLRRRVELINEYDNSKLEHLVEERIRAGDSTETIEELIDNNLYSSENPLVPKPRKKKKWKIIAGIAVTIGSLLLCSVINTVKAFEERRNTYYFIEEIDSDEDGNVDKVRIYKICGDDYDNICEKDKSEMKLIMELNGENLDADPEMEKWTNPENGDYFYKNEDGAYYDYEIHKDGETHNLENSNKDMDYAEMSAIMTGSNLQSDGSNLYYNSNIDHNNVIVDSSCGEVVKGFDDCVVTVDEPETNEPNFFLDLLKNWDDLLPWVVIGGTGVGVAAYARHKRNKDEDDDMDINTFFSKQNEEPKKKKK